MRPEIEQYNFDWMLSSIINTAAKTADGSQKEFKAMLKYIPYFKGVLEPIIGEGAPGIHFLKMIGDYFGNIVNAHERGYKLAATTFCFNPAVLYAMDVVPVTLEVLTTLGGLMWKRGTYDYLDYCVEVGFTETSCSAQRGALGAFLSGNGENLDMVLSDTAGVCDTNANAFSFTSSFLKKPFFQLNYPPTLTDERSVQYHREDYKELIKFLEKQTGKKLDEDRLRTILKEIEKQDDIIDELEELQRLKPSPMPLLYNFFLYAGRFFFVGLPNYTKLLELMLEVVQSNAEKGICPLKGGKENARALFIYIDHYSLNLNMWRWMDDHGIAHLGGILSRFYHENAGYYPDNKDSLYRINTKDLDSMIDSLAEINARMPMVRSIRGPYDKPDMWLQTSLALGKIYQTDCFIYNGTPGCRNTWGMVKLFARDTEKQGFPTHIMNADAFDDRVESWETSKERLEEFMSIRGIL